MQGLNDAPQIHEVREESRSADELAREADEGVHDPFDALEIFGESAAAQARRAHVLDRRRRPQS